MARYTRASLIAPPFGPDVTDTEFASGFFQEMVAAVLSGHLHSDLPVNGAQGLIRSKIVGSDIHVVFYDGTDELPLAVWTSADGLKIDFGLLAEIDAGSAALARTALDVDQAKLIYELEVVAGTQGAIVLPIPSQWSIVDIYTNRFSATSDNASFLMQTGVGTVGSPTWETSFADTLTAVNATALVGQTAILTAIPLIGQTTTTARASGHATIQGLNSSGYVGVLARSYSTYSGPATRQFLSRGAIKEIASTTTLLHFFSSVGTIANLDLKIVGVA